MLARLPACRLSSPPALLQLVLLHLKKTHLLEWVRSVLAVTLGVAPNQDLPPFMLHQEVDSVWKQIRERAGAGRGQGRGPGRGQSAGTWLTWHARSWPCSASCTGRKWELLSCRGEAAGQPRRAQQRARRQNHILAL